MRPWSALLHNPHNCLPFYFTRVVHKQADFHVGRERIRVIVTHSDICVKTWKQHCGMFTAWCQPEYLNCSFIFEKFNRKEAHASETIEHEPTKKKTRKLIFIYSDSHLDGFTKNELSFKSRQSFCGRLQRGEEMSAVSALKASKWFRDAGLSISSCTFLAAVGGSPEFSL